MMFGDAATLYGPMAGFLGISMPILLSLLVIIGIWDAVWKLLGMWEAAKNKSVAWFICIFIFNTVGILPILYLYVFSKKAKRRK